MKDEESKIPTDFGESQIQYYRTASKTELRIVIIEPI